MNVRVELVWNREFDWSNLCRSADLETAIGMANKMLDSGDGERVKKVRIVDNATDKVIWPKHEIPAHERTRP